MKIANLVLVAVLALPALAAAQAAEFKGAVQIGRELGERLLKRPRFDMNRYFVWMEGEDSGSLLMLLGVTVPAGSGTQFINGKPNAINMLLWNHLFFGISRDIGNSCFADTGMEWNPGFRKALDGICQWPAPVAQDPKVMEEFWLALMSYDAPKDEFEAWRDFFLNSSFKNRPAQETVPAMVVAALYNPHFLLRK